MEPQVFICHSSADAVTAREICARLEASGVGCWIAPRDPVPGIPYAQQIVSAIAAVKVVLLVFSSHANESRPVLSEIELASNRGKAVLPVLIESVAPSTSLEFYIRAIHWFDAATRPLADVWPELVADVQELVGPAVSSPPNQTTASQPVAAKAPLTNLPAQLTSFVGREQTISEIEKHLQKNRLVTLVGSGGAGKTRAATEIGAQVLPAFPGGVWLVELAPISDASLVPGAVARVLNVRESPSSPLLETLLEHLKRQRLLLIVDNCEQVIDEVRALAGAILRACPDVRILATSRESLSISGEQVFRLPSLSLPPADATADAEAAIAYDSVALFVDRAVAVDERFALTNENAKFVAEICRRLDGIPLAIELAAARVRVLSPQQLAQRLDERFRVLTGGDRSALPRHQTMRALIDWSYDLLSADEKALFRKVSIFAGGFTLAGAAAVCADQESDEIAVLDLISSLVDKSLVLVDAGVEERYRLLESTRQYAREKLEERGELEQSSNAHLAYLSRLFRKSGEQYEATMAGNVLADIAPELEDARKALDWAEDHAADDAADFFLATTLWAQLGLNREAISRAQRLISRLDEGDNLRLARLWERVAVCSVNIGRGTAALEASRRALQYARQSHDRWVVADCLLRYADVLARARQFDQAFAALDEAAALGPSTMRRDQQAVYLRAVAEFIRGDLDAAASSFSRARDVFASAGNDGGIVSASLNLAEVDHARGATREAIEIATSALPSAERLNDRSTWAWLVRNLAGYLGAAGDAAGARQAAAKAIEFYGSYDPEGPLAAIALEHLALGLALDGDVQTAAILEGYSDATFKRLGFERENTERTSHERLRAALSASLKREKVDGLLARGSGMSASEALAIAKQTWFASEPRQPAPGC